MATERPATTPPTTDTPPPALVAWRCDCPARPLLGRVVGRALKPLVPIALAYRDHVTVRCPACRNKRIYWTKDLPA